ncbi:unnamed protein product [Dicrocoelium dendriticum]|nr:unnamed protein product [Dicrocoelium dendriticum]
MVRFASVYRNNRLAECPFSMVLRFKSIVIAVTSLPFTGLILCTLSSFYVSFDEVTEAICGVSNFIPSISAVTGIAPQLYFWRFAVGLHSTPRVLMAVIYLRYHKFFVDHMHYPNLFNFVLNASFVLNMIDLATFVGVAYVSNSENFPIHERLFVVFLSASSLYMLVTIAIHEILRFRKLLGFRMTHSLRVKKIFFGLTMFFLSFLVYHFYQHRFRCKPNAFSWFSASEYGIAVANMGFHMTAAYDFQDLIFVTSMRKISSK